MRCAKGHIIALCILCAEMQNRTNSLEPCSVLQVQRQPEHICGKWGVRVGSPIQTQILLRSDSQIKCHFKEAQETEKIFNHAIKEQKKLKDFWKDVETLCYNRGNAQSMN